MMKSMLTLFMTLAWSPMGFTAEPYTSGEAEARAAQTRAAIEQMEAIERPKINQGDWEIGGSGSFFQSDLNGRESISITPKAEFFFLNRFSAGGKVRYLDTSEMAPAASVGPSLTYYFALVEDFAFYVDQSVLYTNPSGSGDNYFTGESGVGVDWFIDPSVAIGPSLRSIYHFSGNTQDPDEGFTVAVNLSVFL